MYALLWKIFQRCSITLKYVIMCLTPKGKHLFHMYYCRFLSPKCTQYSQQCFGKTDVHWRWGMQGTSLSSALYTGQTAKLMFSVLYEYFLGLTSIGKVLQRKPLFIPVPCDYLLFMNLLVYHCRMIYCISSIFRYTFFLICRILKLESSYSRQDRKLSCHFLIGSVFSWWFIK